MLLRWGRFVLQGCSRLVLSSPPCSTVSGLSSGCSAGFCSVLGGTVLGAREGREEDSRPLLSRSLPDGGGGPHRWQSLKTFLGDSEMLLWVRGKVGGVSLCSLLFSGDLCLTKAQRHIIWRPSLQRCFSVWSSQLLLLDRLSRLCATFTYIFSLIVRLILLVSDSSLDLTTPVLSQVCGLAHVLLPLALPPCQPPNQSCPVFRPSHTWGSSSIILLKMWCWDSWGVLIPFWQSVRSKYFHPNTKTLCVSFTCSFTSEQNFPEAT